MQTGQQLVFTGDSIVSSRAQTAERVLRAADALQGLRRTKFRNFVTSFVTKKCIMIAELSIAEFFH